MRSADSKRIKRRVPDREAVRPVGEDAVDRTTTGGEDMAASGGAVGNSDARGGPHPPPGATGVATARSWADKRRKLVRIGASIAAGPATATEAAAAAPDGWLALPLVLWGCVFDAVPPRDVLVGVERVCRTWRHASAERGCGWARPDQGLDMWRDFGAGSFVPDYHGGAAAGARVLLRLGARLDHLRGRLVFAYVDNTDLDTNAWVAVLGAGAFTHKQALAPQAPAAEELAAVRAIHKLLRTPRPNGVGLRIAPVYLLQLVPAALLGGRVELRPSLSQARHIEHGWPAWVGALGPVSSLCLEEYNLPSDVFGGWFKAPPRAELEHLELRDTTLYDSAHRDADGRLTTQAFDMRPVLRVLPRLQTLVYTGGTPAQVPLCLPHTLRTLVLHAPWRSGPVESGEAAEDLSLARKAVRPSILSLLPPPDAGALAGVKLRRLDVIVWDAERWVAVRPWVGAALRELSLDCLPVEAAASAPQALCAAALPQLQTLLVDTPHPETWLAIAPGVGELLARQLVAFRLYGADPAPLFAAPPATPASARAAARQARATACQSSSAAQPAARGPRPPRRKAAVAAATRASPPIPTAARRRWPRGGKLALLQLYAPSHEAMRIAVERAVTSQAFLSFCHAQKALRCVGVPAIAVTTRWVGRLAAASPSLRMVTVCDWATHLPHVLMPDPVTLGTPAAKNGRSDLETLILHTLHFL